MDPSIVNTAVEVAKECYCVLPLLNGSGGNRRESVITNEDYEMVLSDNTVNNTRHKTQNLGLFTLSRVSCLLLLLCCFPSRATYVEKDTLPVLHTK